MKTHMNFGTRDLERSVAFYQALLDASPIKRFDDYALFVTDDPGLELALDLDPGAHESSSEHFGIAVDGPDDVDRAAERLRRAGLSARVEGENVCCYAKQTKVWAIDPEGRRWETYSVLEETESRDGETECCRGGQP